MIGKSRLGTVDRCALAARASKGRTVVEAGFGFGKSTLLSQVVTSHGGPVHIIDGSELALGRGIDRIGEQLAAVSRADDGLLVVTAAEALSESVVDHVVGALTSDPALNCMIVGRFVPSVLRRLCADRIDSEDLALTAGDLRRLLGAEDGESAEPLIDLLLDLTDGWPLAVIELLDSYHGAGGGHRGVNEVMQRGGDLSSVATPLLEACDDVAPLLPLLARLVVFDDHIVKLLGFDPSAVDEIRRAGVPVVESGRWLQLLPVFRSLFQVRQPVDGSIDVQAIARHFAGNGMVLNGIDTCLAFGDPEAAASLIDSLSYHHRLTLSLDDLNDRMRALDHHLDAHPGALLFQSRMNLAGLRLREGHQLLDRATSAARAAGAEGSRVLVEALVEQAFWAYTAGDADRARDRLDEAEALPIAMEPDVAVRASEARAGLRTLTGRVEDLDRAAIDLAIAVDHWRSRGATARLASARMRLAIHVLEPLGRVNDALEVLSDALAAPSISPLDRARVQVFRARLLPLIGEIDEAAEASGQALRLAEWSDFAYVSGMAHWALVTIASYQGDEAALVEHLLHAEKALGELLDHETGAMFRADAAVALARCRHAGAAWEQLDLAERVPCDSPSVPLARASLEARFGDADAALQLIDGCRAESTPADGWRLDALAALCARRNGDDDEFRRWCVAAQASSAELGIDPNLVAAITGAGLVDVQPGPRRREPQDDEVVVELFGRFRLKGSGRALRTPTGHAATLLKLLVTNHRAAKVDQVVDVLWPDVDLATGRRRLRNVLSRLHRSNPTMVERVEDSLLLSEAVSSDYGRVVADAESALRERRDDLRAANEALAAMAPEARLLQENRYDDWAETIRREYIALQERLTDHRDRLAQQLRADRADVIR